MIDFTKDELEEIIMWTCHLVGCNPTLLNKIQSMIDNYCEHDEHHYYGDISAAECKQCGMVMLP